MVCQVASVQERVMQQICWQGPVRIPCAQQTDKAGSSQLAKPKLCIANLQKQLDRQLPVRLVSCFIIHTVQQ